MSYIEIYTNETHNSSKKVCGYGSMIWLNWYEEDYHKNKIIKSISGTKKDVTKNRIELINLIEVCKYLLSSEFEKMIVKYKLERIDEENEESPIQIKVITNSEYILDGMINRIEMWQKMKWKSIPNNDLWNILINLTNELKIKGILILLSWVKDEQSKKNEMVEKLAKSEMKKIL